MKKEKHICFSCLGEFDDKEIYWIDKKTHSILHCMKCIENNKIESYIPYLKPRKTRTKKEK